MNKIATVKLVARVIVGVGTTHVTKSIIQNNVVCDNPLESVTVAVASAAIGSMVSVAVMSHTDSQIDALVDAWTNAKSAQTATA